MISASHARVASLTARAISPVVRTSTRSTPYGVGSATGPQTSVASDATVARRLRDGEPHLPGRTVADVAHGVERLLRAAGADDDPPPREVAARRVAAAPADGKANGALIRLLASRLDIAPSSVALVSGARSRNKLLVIRGLTQDEVWRRLALPDANSATNERRPLTSKPADSSER